VKDIFIYLLDSFCYDEYLINLKENNISNILSDKNQFKMIHVNAASHLTIVQEEDLIINKIKSFVK
jgi:hypothetical protein